MTWHLKADGSEVSNVILMRPAGRKDLIVQYDTPDGRIEVGQFSHIEWREPSTASKLRTSMARIIRDETA